MSHDGSISEKTDQRLNSPLLRFNAKGIYCEVADVYIDPWYPVDRAIITHGHADHSRWGHKSYITHHDNVPIIMHRLGDISVSGREYGETFTIRGVTFSLHPAGHIIGSAQVRVEYRGEVWVCSGDYKLQEDGVSVPFEPVRCHAFITECTFGLPTFKWLPQSTVMAEINEWWSTNRSNGQTSVLFGYSLGKAQRLLKHLDPEIGPIYTHGAIEKMTEVCRTLIDLPETHLVTKETTKKDLRGSMVIAPPSTHGSRWLRRMVPYVTGSASGWMAFRGARRRRAIDKGFVLSDHADWDGLISAIEATGAERIICTHGYTDIFSRYLIEQGYDARTAETQYGEEESETKTEEVEA